MSDLILVEQAGPILKIGINRPDKRNAMNQEMFRGLATAYTRLCDDPELRCGILYSTTDLFTAGLDLMDMASVLTGQDDAPQLVEEDQVDPFDWASVAGKQGRKRTKPIISAIQGKCYAAGIEVALGTDFIIATENAEFAQAEIRRGLMPLGGAIDRLVKYTGRANAMRWLLTGDIFDVHEAHRMGLVQEVVADGQALERAL
ncbi:MAG: enoyl-CoA hydratase-related protein, partial [Pseudomonadales bacterium]